MRMPFKQIDSSGAVVCSVRKSWTLKSKLPRFTKMWLDRTSENRFTVEAAVTFFGTPDKHAFIVSDLPSVASASDQSPDGRLQAMLNDGENSQADPDGCQSIVSRNDLTLNTPTHVAATFDRQILKLFPDGNPDNEAPPTGLLTETAREV